MPSYIRIHNWEQYSASSRNEQHVARQFEHLLWTDYTSLHALQTLQTCDHNSFKSQQSFLNLLRGYIGNDVNCVQILRNNDHIKTGICLHCIQQFLIETNGLTHVFAKWTSCAFNKSYQFQFSNTNIIICDEPFFIKWILLPSNIRILKRIFKLFFITYLKHTNLNEFVYDIEILPHRSWSQWKFFIHNDIISRLHSFEHSLCSLSTTIISLLPLLKWFHIKHLFIDDTELKSIAHIIYGFGVQYANLPHIKHYKDRSRALVLNHHRNKYETWLQRLNTDPAFARNWPYRTRSGDALFKFNTSHLYYSELCEVFIKTKHPILRRIGHIVASLYQHFSKYKSRLKKQWLVTNDATTKRMWQQMTELRNDLKYIAFGTRRRVPPPSIDDFCNGTQFENICKVSYFYNQCYVSNNQLKKVHNQNIRRCAKCHKSQKDCEGNRKWKVCSGCKLIFYCSRKCQKYDWSRNQHSRLCKQLQVLLK
eukprot:496614_1